MGSRCIGAVNQSSIVMIATLSEKKTIHDGLSEEYSYFPEVTSIFFDEHTI
ncbi:hypothetical protein D3C75_1314870 [compost metagenome]